MRPPQDADAKVYRDRAAERREGGVGDYADSEQLLSHLNSTSNDRQAAYEQSKYLGGDVARTHLVRGLDYLLLEKMRGSNGISTSSATTDLDNEVDRLLCAPPSGDDAPPAAEKMPEANTAVGKQVMAAVQQIYKTRIDRRNMPSSASDLFMPGRMCFEIRVAAANGAVRATTRIRSQDEVPAAGHSAHNGNSCDRAVLTKVVAAIAAGRHRRIEARYLQEQYADKPPAVNAPAAVVGAGAVGDAEDEEDIFAEAGVDYHEEDEAVTAPYPKKEDDAVTAPYPMSEDEGVTAPYPMSEDERVTAPYPMLGDDMKKRANY
ncbi:hypothetical protein IWW47_000302 [Coemansia sp. RSA 2052]|nr:hypothetical protein IWW47_000302 [Coemansia sp. RSA 2052]